MAFHDVSHNQVATVTHNLTHLLGLGPTFCSQVDRVSFRNSETMIALSRQRIKIMLRLLEEISREHSIEMLRQNGSTLI